MSRTQSKLAWMPQSDALAGKVENLNEVIEAGNFRAT